MALSNRFSLGLIGDVPGTVEEKVGDGDTINVHAVNNFGVRFLGVDAPEMKARFPGRGLVQLSDPLWDHHLRDCFEVLKLSSGLTEYLRGLLNEGVAENHFQHATAAKLRLIEFIRKDMAELGLSEDTFRFYLSSAHDVTDRYGRFLGFINRYQKEVNRPRSYNERLLAEGLVSPYFIWPNINPFKQAMSLGAAVIEPGTSKELAEKDTSLRWARNAVRYARDEGIGIYDRKDPLILLPFELRLLADRRAPVRWVINLSKNDNLLIHPERYFQVPNPEDRLYVPEEFVPLFIETGWERESGTI
jgi:endonuclease YncB( thermonuclease family)